MRGKLKEYLKTEKVVAMQVGACEPVFVRVKSLGWFTVTLDVLDTDEETWLATEVVSIKDIFSINESSIQRARVRLMFENADPSELEQLKASLMVGYEDDEDLDEDEDDYT